MPRICKITVGGVSLPVKGLHIVKSKGKTYTYLQGVYDMPLVTDKTLEEFYKSLDEAKKP